MDLCHGGIQRVGRDRQREAAQVLPGRLPLPPGWFRLRNRAEYQQQHLGTGLHRGGRPGGLHRQRQCELVSLHSKPPLRVPRRKGQQVARADGPEFLAPITSDYFQNNPKEKHSSAAGHAVYTSRRFPEDWWNKRVLVCEPPMHLVSAPRIKRRGDRFETTGFEHKPLRLRRCLVGSGGCGGRAGRRDLDGGLVQPDLQPQSLPRTPSGRGRAMHSDRDDRDREHGRIYRIYPRGTQDEPYPNLQTGPEALAALEHPIFSGA